MVSCKVNLFTLPNKSRGLRKKQNNLTPDDQLLDEIDEAIEIINVSEYQLDAPIKTMARV